MRHKNLSNHLFIINSLTLFLGFCLIFFTVNHVARRYVHEMTTNSMQSNFTILDSIYAHQPIPETQVAKKDSIYVWADYAIFDDKYQLKYTNSDYKKTSHLIMSFLQKNHYGFKGNPQKGYFVPIKGKTFYVTTKKYQGKLEDDFIIKSKTETRKTFYVINFSDVTNTQKLIDQINTYLLLLLFLTYLGMLFIMQRTFKGIQKSIHSVQNYIAQLWRDHDQHFKKEETIFFSDFDPLLQESQEMANRIQEAEKSQLTFFQNASHELRTPLMSIQGYTEGLQAGIIQESFAYQIILEESQKMKVLVDDIMLLSRLDSPSKVEKSQLKLFDVLQSTATYFQPLIDQQGLKLVQDYKHFDVIITGNEALLERAFSNIINNAMRYAKTTIEIIASDRQIKISNDGEPISKQELPYIFDRFYKGEKGQTGIGLSMVKEIVKQHNGSVEVISQPEKTQFIISF